MVEAIGIVFLVVLGVTWILIDA